MEDNATVIKEKESAAAPAETQANANGASVEKATEPEKTEPDGPTGPKGTPGDKGGETLLDNGAPESKGTADNGSLLDDGPEKKDAQPEGGSDVAPTEEQVKAFTEGLKAVDLGEGVKWDDPLLTAMTPELMKASGNDPKRAEGIVKAYTAHQQAVAKALSERESAFNKALVAQCRERYGDDLGKVVALAKKGGAAIFGDKIWNEMKRVPSFANNPDVIGKLAEFGRRFATDDGKVSPVGAPHAESGGDVLHRMYGSVKV